jgi:hypothetical protein
MTINSWTATGLAARKSRENRVQSINTLATMIDLGRRKGLC